MYISAYSAYFWVHSQHCSLILAEGYGIVNWRFVNSVNLQIEAQIWIADPSSKP